MPPLPDGFTELLAAIVIQAAKDAKQERNWEARRTAQMFLRMAGLLGRIDRIAPEQDRAVGKDRYRRKA